MQDVMEVKPKMFWKMVHPEDLEWMEKKWENAEKMKIPYSGTFRIKLKNGKVKVKNLQL